MSHVDALESERPLEFVEVRTRCVFCNKPSPVVSLPRESMDESQSRSKLPPSVCAKRSAGAECRWLVGAACAVDAPSAWRRHRLLAADP